MFISPYFTDVVCSRLRSDGGSSSSSLAAKIRELLAGQLVIPVYRELDSGPATLGQPVPLREAPFILPLTVAAAATAPLVHGTPPPVSSRRVVTDTPPGSPALLASPYLTSPLRTAQPQARLDYRVLLLSNSSTGTGYCTLYNASLQILINGLPNPSFIHKVLKATGTVF